MATDNSATSGIQLSWAGKQVHQELVEEELTRLWHLAADNMRISQNMNVRTSVLNFVICTRDVESAHKVSTLLRDLSSTHIARVTLLILDTSSDAPTDISTWVTLRSFPVISDLMRHHFEQVTVAVHGAATQYAANIIQPLLKPDLPVYLWWLEDLPENSAIFQRFVAISSRVIVDSSHFQHPAGRLQTIMKILQETPKCAISDLSWSRVTALRELIAQFFDVPQYRSYLMGVNHITIEYTAPTYTSDEESGQSSVSPTSLGALFLAAWLKNRLGWQLSTEPEDNQRDPASGTYGWYMTQRDMSKVVTQPATNQVQHQLDTLPSNPLNGVQFIVRPREQENSEPGTICLVRLQSTAEGHEAAFTIERGDNDDIVITSAELPGSIHPPRTVNVAATHKESELLRNELEIMGRDHLYEETIQEVIALLA
jgi:glucose-6-phosphate dehydrogenase assembly protein OpcA